MGTSVDVSFIQLSYTSIDETFDRLLEASTALFAAAAPPSGVVRFTIFIDLRAKMEKIRLCVRSVEGNDL